MFLVSKYLDIACAFEEKTLFCSGLCSLTSLTSSPKALMQGKFPPKSPSNNCLPSVTGTSPQELKVAELQPATRFALASLSACVLRLDFWDDEEPGSIFFSKVAFEIVVSHLEISEKAVRTIKTHLESAEDLPDLVALITTIKNDPLVFQNGTITVLSSLLLAFINSDIECIYVISQLFYVWYGTILKMWKTRLHQLWYNKLLSSPRLTGGLAAPLVAAGAGAIIGTAGAAGIATTAGAAVLGTTFGVAGAGLGGYKMSKRVGAIEEFTIESLSEGLSLHCALAVSGWIDENESCEMSFKQQWRYLNLSLEQYTLRYESKYLIELGEAMNYIMSIALSLAIQKTLMETALAGLMTAVVWPVAILSCANVLDNPWNVGIARAAEDGEHLAEVLLSRSHGKRPISLVGFSLGARVIHHCLLAMSKRSEAAVLRDVHNGTTTNYEKITRMERVCDCDWIR
ncbi:unnamed protein product [Cylicocyclus nassatus]|uniref:Transmembrane and coiled-coil domain-containing protein 4 n=1 Tax=Cylicocyclus nassatus TaxID=53992 RepID=A0AA36H9W4_CYLNA|nr:unnamed protein product [Cylicocyclus nassatus]